MRVAPVLIAVAAASCRIDFDPISGGAAPPELVQNSSVLVGVGVTPSLGIAPTRPGTLLAVVTVNIDDAVTAASGVSDDAGDTFQLAPSTYSCAGLAIGQIWYAENGAGGATRITVEQPTSPNREVWAVEVSGIRATSSLAGTAQMNDTPQPAVINSPPVTPTAIPAFVITVVNVSGTVTGFDATSGFVPLGPLHGDEAAYAIATTPGAYSARWTANATGVYCGGTAAFAAGR